MTILALVGIMVDTLGIYYWVNSYFNVVGMGEGVSTIWYMTLLTYFPVSLTVAFRQTAYDEDRRPSRSPGSTAAWLWPMVATGIMKPSEQRLELILRTVIYGSNYSCMSVWLFFDYT